MFIMYTAELKAAVRRLQSRSEEKIMAYDLALNVGSWDLAIDNDDLILTDGAERIAQQILITLRFWYGEWFLDTEDGTPYLEYILVKNPNIFHIKQILRERILSVEGVSNLESLEVNYNPQERYLIVEYSAMTNYGLVTREEVLSSG